PAGSGGGAAMMQPHNLAGARTQALVMTVGLFTFVRVGLAGCLALVMAAFYLAASLVLWFLQALADVFGSVAPVWTAAPPLLKIVLLAGVAYGVYRLWRKGKKAG